MRNLLLIFGKENQFQQRSLISQQILLILSTYLKIKSAHIPFLMNQKFSKLKSDFFSSEQKNRSLNVTGAIQSHRGHQQNDNKTFEEQF